MRPILCLLLLLLSFAGRAQTDRNGNPVFNSVTLETDTFDGCELSYNYYTLQNNIDNPASSVFIDKKPSLNQIEAAAVKLPSHFFVLTRNEQVVSMVLLTEDPRRQYVVVDLNTGEPKTFPCTLTGDLPEERVLELLDLGWDPAAKRQDNRFYFNDKPFTILPAAALQADVRKLIQAQKLTEAAASDTRIVSSAVLRAAILRETAAGGQLDFFTPLAGKEQDGVQVKPGVYATRLSMAYYQWGRAAFEEGVNTLADALDIWKAFKGRPATEREAAYIEKGFKKELEK